MRVLSPRGDFEAHPEATDDLDAIADADVVFIGLKAYSLPGARPAARRGAQAGRGRDRRRRTAFPGGTSRRTAARSTAPSLESVDPGGAIARRDPAGAR